MELPRSTSPACSLASSLDSNGLPISRIKCCKEKIFIGDRHYPSASEALMAYLRQFEIPSAVDRNGASLSPSPLSSLTNGSSDAGRTDRELKSSLSSELNGICLENKKDEVEQLLTSKVSPELKEEVTDTLREIKLKNLLKKAVSKSQKPGKTGLQQEVEAALARSAQLLEKVTMDDIKSTRAALSDISDISLPTQLLLADSGGSSKSNDSILSQDMEDLRGKQNGHHVYSYHTDYLNRSRHRQRHQSSDDITIPNQYLLSPPRLSPSASSISSSKLSDLSDNLKRIRSRSVPPGSVRNKAPESLGDINKSGSRSVPSWIKDVSPNSSILSNSDKKWDSSKPVIPQWVEDAAKSDVSTDIVTEHRRTTPSIHTRSRHRQLSNTTNHSKSEGDLSKWRDDEDSKTDMSLSNLISSPLHSSEKHVTFTDSLAIPIASHQPHHSTPLRGRYQQKNSSESSINNKIGGSYLNGEVLLRNGNLIQAKALDNANMSDTESDLKSTSLDTLALLTGRPQTRCRSSDIMKGKTLAQKVFSESPMLSSIEQDRTILSPSPASSANGQMSSDGLDGDRSWEKHTNTFKPPVPVGNCDQNYGKVNGCGDNMQKNLSASLSGGNQPGSMETLKNMLFKLQKEETSVNTSNSNMDSVEQTTQNPSALPALQDYDFQTEPGGHSLEKALHHLDRLKILVKNTATSGQTEAVNGHGEKESNSVTS